MAGDLVLLAAFFVEAHPAAPALDKIVADFHLEFESFGMLYLWVLS
jgi:hypothetical protein